MAAEAAELQPWGPQPGEPGTSFAGFVLYRETLPSERSLRLVAARMDRSLSLIERYSARWTWVTRTRAWDAEQAQRRAEHARKVETDWVERHADTGRRLQSLGVAGIGNVLERDAGGGRAWDKLKPSDFMRMIAIGSSLEVTAATHAAGTVEEAFVTRVVEVLANVFVEVNDNDDPQIRAKAFAEGCTRAVQQLLH